MPTTRRRYHRIQGRVQGVGFRQFVQEKARELGLVGYVRNLKDGDVELQAEGPEEDLDRLLETLRQGPPAARVDNVKIDCLNEQKHETRFSIAPR